MWFDLNQGIKGGKYSVLKIFHHQDKLKSLLEKKVTAPLYIRVKPTNRCNHRCGWCVYDPKFSSIHTGSNRTDEIPREKMMEVLDDFSEMGVKAATFSGGGEPLVYPHITEVLKKTLEKKIGLSMITNGQLLEGRNAELLQNADWVRVSLDYHNPELFTQIRQVPKKMFYEVRKNLYNFAKNKNESCDLGVNCVVNHMNYTSLEDIAKFCKDLGVGNLRFAPLWKKDFIDYHKSFKNKAIEQIEKAKELQDENFSVGSTYGRYFDGNTGGDKREYPRCFYMEIVPVIAADQSIYTCHNNAYEPSGKVGSIKKQSFKDLWFNEETAEFFKNFNPQEVCKHECSNDEKNRVLNEFESCKNKGVVEYI